MPACSLWRNSLSNDAACLGVADQHPGDQPVGSWSVIGVKKAIVDLHECHLPVQGFGVVDSGSIGS